MEVEEQDREKTAFTAGNGLWQFNVMAFGLCNTPTTFERLMDNILGDLRCLVYLDDMIAHAKTFELELQRLTRIFSRLRVANLKLNPKKCELFRHRVKFLGHVVSEEGVASHAPSWLSCVLFKFFYSLEGAIAEYPAQPFTYVTVL